MRSLMISCFLVIFLIPALNAQDENIIPARDIKEAIANGTRTAIGVPGERYWQNRADYEIMVTLVPSKRILQGEETITYFNNSPQKLGKIVFKLYQNLYKTGAARDFSLSPNDIHSGVDWEFRHATEEKLDTAFEDGTNLIARLKDSLKPGDSLKLSLRWEFEIPGHSDVRMGAMNDSAFFLGFWYPRIAVYDDLSGWDLIQHTGNQEFYHDRGDYEVYIAVPRGYMVMATGVLQNPNVVFKKPYLERYQKALKSDSIVSVVDKSDISRTSEIFSKNVWIYKAKNVPDFAFGASNHHLWDATSILIDTVSEQRVLVQSAYKKESKDFEEVAEFAKKTLQYLSFEFPGYPYPFPAVSIFNGTNGSSGMEYPMIANNPSAAQRGRTLDVTAHEITHNFLPFYVLTNETQYAWMDEAFAAMIPYKLQEKTEPSLNRLTRYTKRVSSLADSEEHVSTMTLSSAISGRVPYYFTNYTKPALALYYLEEILGTENFEKAIQEYFTIWQGKHPTPYDFFFFMNRETQSNLNWFWKPWFFEPAWPDLGILKVEEETHMYKITIKRKGDLPVPVRLKVTFEDGTNYSVNKAADVWKEGNNHLVVPLKTNKEIRRIKLGDEYIPDVSKEDNVYTINR